VTAALGYHAMRMRWCRASLVAFVRRWGVYLAVVALVAGAGASSGVAAVRALAAWTVLPLFRAAIEGSGHAAVAVLLQAAVGGLLVAALRELLWPLRWRLAERALPLRIRATVASDLIVVAWALAPLWLLYSVGAQALLANDLEWLRPGRGRAVAALVLAAAGSVLLGVAVLQWLRRPLAARPRQRIDAATRGARMPPPSMALGRRWPVALLMLPLWRGPARRSGGVLLTGSLLLAATATAIAMLPSATPWSLAAYAALAMLLTARLRRLAAADLGALLEAVRPLPIPSATVRAGLVALLLSPVLATLPMLLAALPWHAVRPLVLAAFASGIVACCAAEAGSTSVDAATVSSRWLFSVALLVALASEVVA